MLFDDLLQLLHSLWREILLACFRIHTRGDIFDNIKLSIFEQSIGYFLFNQFFLSLHGEIIARQNGEYPDFGSLLENPD